MTLWACSVSGLRKERESSMLWPVTPLHREFTGRRLQISPRSARHILGFQVRAMRLKSHCGAFRRSGDLESAVSQ